MHREIPRCYLFFLVLKNSQNMLSTKWHFHFSEINMTANKKLFRIKLNYRNSANGGYIGIPKVQEFIWIRLIKYRSQWPRGLRRGSAASRLLRSWVQIPPGAWMSVMSVVCCQVEVSATSWSLVQRSPADCVVSVVCDQEKSREWARA